MHKKLIVLLAITFVSTAPPAKVLYDQRQDGDWNVHANLENIVVMVIPTSSGGTSAGVESLLSYLVRSIPVRNQVKKFEKFEPKPEEETKHFIEAKTAPYHVDISKSHLAKLHPEVPQLVEAEEVVIAKSPMVELHQRAVRNVKKTESNLKLLGAQYEQCGPGLIRDAEGICRVVKL